MRISESNIAERYEEFKAQHGNYEALQVLKNTVQGFRATAKREEKRLFNLVKAECLQKLGYTPANRRTLREAITENPAAFEGISTVQEYKNRFLSQLSSALSP